MKMIGVGMNDAGAGMQRGCDDAGIKMGGV